MVEVFGMVMAAGMPGHPTSEQLAVLLLAIALLLLVARGFGEIARRFQQPAVIGEILAGIVLGPTIFGAIFPEASNVLFPMGGHLEWFLHAFASIALTLFMLVAGMEVDLSTIWRQGKAAVYVGLVGMFVPFGIAMGVALVAPDLLGWEAPLEADDSRTVFIFALFMGVAISISALPVIARTLIDLRLFRTDFAMVVMAAAILQDLAGWIVFAVLLALIGVGGHGFSLEWTIGLTLGFAAFTLTAVRWAVDRMLPVVQAHLHWPGGVLTFAIVLTLLGGAFTEWIGVHAIFGAFLMGVAIGDSAHLRRRTRAILEQFVSFIFAPVFFASIGLYVNFITHFDLLLVIIIVVLATVGKVLGAVAGARMGAMPWRESFSVGFAMNARGAMEIIMGLLALQYQLISERLFVALVVMALLTSMLSGPMVQWALKARKPHRLNRYIKPAGFVKPLNVADKNTAIRRLSEAAAQVAGIPVERVISAVMEREALMSTGLEHGVAVPHARLDDLTAPVVCLGIVPDGVEFDAPDGIPATLIFLILTPRHDRGAQLELISEIGSLMVRDRIRAGIRTVNSHTELLATLNIDSDHNSH